jgi:hypothetical protein
MAPPWQEQCSCQRAFGPYPGVVFVHGFGPDWREPYRSWRTTLLAKASPRGSALLGGVGEDARFVVRRMAAIARSAVDLRLARRHCSPARQLPRQLHAGGSRCRKISIVWTKMKPKTPERPRQRHRVWAATWSKENARCIEKQTEDDDDRDCKNAFVGFSAVVVDSDRPARRRRKSDSADVTARLHSPSVSCRS